LAGATAGNRKCAELGCCERATSYNVARATATSQYTTLRTGVTGTSYTDTSVANGTTYYYRIIAVNSFNQSGGSMS
jgi:cellulose 1,4-beta-cellobiosidase